MNTSEMMDKSYIAKEQDYLKKELEYFTNNSSVKEKDEEMSAQDICEIFCKTRPELFNHIFKECEVIYKHKPNDDDDLYFENEELNIAKAIVYDYGTRANKIGRIIVASTQ